MKIIHIALAAAWFGHKLLVPGDIKASIRSQTTEAQVLVARLRRAERLGIATGVGTLIAGVALAYAVDASTVGYGVWVGATLVVAAIAVGAIFARPVSTRLRTAVASGDRVAATVAGNQLGRILGVEELLWIGALTGMVIG
ncbi:MAG: hypothetical protein WAL25_08275 [Acidimicrobiia bacterium]